ncbi:MAG: hypothetical protein Q8S13_03965, partial [Dehalococcoidia bacterium]|nr:hypothetical protein [Dehalococcoidia bacterium]
MLDEIDLTAPGAVVGRHSVWLPDQGLKFPFQFGGQITKYACPGEAGYPITSLAHEIAILRELGRYGMAPPVGGVVYARRVVSAYGGAWRSDPCGAYGYEMADAKRLPPGHFNLDAMRALAISGSSGAWG